MYKMKKICKLVFMHYKYVHQVHTSCLCVYVLLMFLLSLKNECFWKVTTSTGLSILGSLIKTTIITLLDICAGEWLQYTFNFLEWVLKKKNICPMFWTIYLVSICLFYIIKQEHLRCINHVYIEPVSTWYLSPVEI